MVKTAKRLISTGKRKTAIARIQILPGEGKIVINQRPIENYFGRKTLHYVIQQPFEATGTVGKFDVTANLQGGGPSGQAGSLRHAISKGLLAMNADYRKPLKTAGLLTRDSRIVESKKYGRHKARRGNQWTKR